VRLEGAGAAIAAIANKLDALIETLRRQCGGRVEPEPAANQLAPSADS